MRCALLVLLLFASCGDDGAGDFVLTAEGYRVRFVDQGTVATGRMALKEIHDSLSYSISTLADPALKAKASEVAYDIVDNHSFLSGDVWACGQWLPWANTVKVCLYSQGVSVSVPTDAPPWTVRPSWRDPALMVWGVAPPSLPALAHELEHAVYGSGQAKSIEGSVLEYLTPAEN